MQDSESDYRRMQVLFGNDGRARYLLKIIDLLKSHKSSDKNRGRYMLGKILSNGKTPEELTELIKNAAVFHTALNKQSNSSHSIAQNLLKDNIYSHWSNLSINVRNYYDKYITKKGYDSKMYYNVNTEKFINDITSILNMNGHDSFAYAISANYQESLNDDSTYNPSNVQDHFMSLDYNEDDTNLVYKQLFSGHQSPRAPVSMPASEDVFVSMEDSNLWRRDGLNGSFYTEIDGRKYKYGDNDEETRRIIKNSMNCYSTGLEPGDHCEKFMHECILSRDPNSLEKCIDSAILNKGIFANFARDQVKSIHPKVAQTMLEKFGFVAEQQFDHEYERRLYKYPSVEEWIRNVVAKKLDNDNVEELRSNSHLTTYLQYLVQHVNANPSILNGSTFTGNTDESVGTFTQTDYAKNLGIKPYRVPYDRESAGEYDFGKLSLGLSSGFMGNKRDGISITFGNSFGLNNGFPFQFGGHTSMVEKAVLVERELKQSLSTLADHGKSVDPAEIKTVFDRISRMRQIGAQIDKVNDFLSNSARNVQETGDYEQKTFSIYDDKIISGQNKLEMLMTKFGKEEYTMAHIIRALYSLVKDQK